nr:MAG TPA: hypothetical protein [Caudoviricetes sp.]
MQMYIQYVHTPGAKLRSAIKTIPASDSWNQHTFKSVS